VYMRMWCANWCVVVLDWYMYRGLSRSGVSGAGALMHELCLLLGGLCGAGVIWCTRGSIPVMGR